MLRHITIRTLMIIPTLVLISIIAFFLSAYTPSDPVERALALEGVSSLDDRISQDNYNKAYQRKAKELHKDVSLFYLSIRPSHMPSQQEWNQIQYRDRSTADDLIKQYIPAASVTKYLSALNHFENLYEQEKDSLDKTLKSDLSRLISALRKPTNLGIIRKQMINMANEYQDTPQIDQITDFLTDIPADGPDYTWHTPILEWNGTNNQYHAWISDFIQGDFGTSQLDAQPAKNKIQSALKWTILLIILSLIVVLSISIPIALYSAYRANSWIDNLISTVCLAVYAIPVFWLATLLIVYFTSDTYGGWLDIFPAPASFYSEADTGVFGLISKYFGRLILPVVCISFSEVAYITRVLRADILKESEKEYARTLRAKGMDAWTVTWKHLLPNSLISLTTLIVSNVPLALSGILIIEVIFNIPGMGRLMLSSITNSDWSVVYSMLMLISLITVIFFLVGDILYALLNPRISYSSDE